MYRVMSDLQMRLCVAWLLPQRLKLLPPRINFNNFPAVTASGLRSALNENGGEKGSGEDAEPYWLSLTPSLVRGFSARLWQAHGTNALTQEEAWEQVRLQ